MSVNLVHYALGCVSHREKFKRMKIHQYKPRENVHSSHWLVVSGMGAKTYTQEGLEEGPIFPMFFVALVQVGPQFSLRLVAENC